MSNLPAYILNSCTKIVRSLLPQQCVLCGTSASNQLLCPDCDTDLTHARDPACPVCALPTSGSEVCGVCLQHAPAFDHTLAAFSYHFPIDRLLHAFKYASNLALVEILASPLAKIAANYPKPDALIPMPLHAARLRERGFNQSLELAKPISRWLDIPLIADACQRTRNTPTQAGLKLKERQRNMRGAFTCELDLTGRKIAILDDVMTTGATLNEISQVLKERGAIEVSAWVVARTPHRN